MRPPKLLDSHAMLAYLNRERGAGKVIKAMIEARDSLQLLLMSQINVGEVYYILSRKRGVEKADYFLETILPELPVQVEPVDFSTVIEAARMKARRPLSYADCFAVATALKVGAIVLTGDPEFKAVEEFVNIDWLADTEG